MVGKRWFTAIKNQFSVRLIIFRAFPSKATAARKKKLEELEPKIEETEKKLGSLDQMITEAQVGREEGEDRTQVLAELTELRNRREVLRAEIQKYRDCDPELLEELKQEIKMSADGANRFEKFHI